MKKVYGAVPWRYEEGRDPKVLQNFNGFGHTLFVSRHRGKVDPVFKELFKDTIVNDPGLKIFKTYYCAGTGDVFYLCAMEVGNIRDWQYLKSKRQKSMDLSINEKDKVKELKQQVQTALERMFEHPTASDSNRIEFYDDYKAACEKYEAHKQQLRTKSVEYKEIQKFQDKINYAKSKLHQKAIRFETSFKVNLDPQFKADQKLLKKGPKQLEKSWKQTASDLAHAKCREKVIRKTGRLGNVYVPVGEACSTMTCPVCCTLHSPGTHYLHSCPKCQSTSIRDESGRAIGLMASVNASFALGKLNKSDYLNGQAFGTESLRAQSQSNGLPRPIPQEFW